MLEDLRQCTQWFAAERFGEDEAKRLVAEAEGDEGALFQLYRNLVNVREPAPVPDDVLAAQDRMLRGRIEAAGIPMR